MGFFFIILILPIIIGLVAGYFVALLVYNKLLKAGSKYPKTIRVITYIITFLLVTGTIYVLINDNFRFER